MLHNSISILAVLSLDLKRLKSETEDTESGLIILRQSGSELDKVTDSLRKLWTMGVKSEDIINLAKALDKETTNNVNYDNRAINNNETIPSDLKKYRNLKTDIEDLSKAKDEIDSRNGISYVNKTVPCDISSVIDL